MARKTHQHLILVTCITSAVAAIIGMVSLGTEEWVSATTEWATGSGGEGIGSSYVNYGLFSGTYDRMLVERSTYQVTMTCVSDGQACALLCRDTAEGREQQLNKLLANAQIEFDPSCPRIQRNVRLHNTAESFLRTIRASGDRTYIDYGLYVSTLLFLGLSIATGIAASGLSVWNTIDNPMHTVFNVYGVIGMNVSAATFATLTMILWGVQYNITLIDNVGLLETITKQMDTLDPSLGYSYWLNLSSIMLYSSSIGLILARQKLLAREPRATNIEMLRSDDRTIVLF